MKTPAWLQKLLHPKQSNPTSPPPATDNEMPHDHHKKSENPNPEVSIQPFPADTNDPADLLKKPKNQDLGANAQLTDNDPPVFAELGPVIPNSETAKNLKIEDTSKPVNQDPSSKDKKTA